MVSRIALAVVVAVSLFSLDVSAQRRGQSYSGITLYDNPDFRGTSVTFRDEIPDLRQHGLNDRATSLEVDGNQAWEVCRDVNFGGGCRVFSGSIEDLREEGWNDRISSVRPVGTARGGRGNMIGNRNRRGGGRAMESRLVLYDRPNYRGDARDILNSSTNLGTVGDRARSVEVYGGTWELCEGAFRNARCVTVSEDVPDLRTLGFRNGVTSAREAAGQGRGRWR
jgi:hypothetical protein